MTIKEIRIISSIQSEIPQQFFLPGDSGRICVVAGNIGTTIAEASDILRDLSLRFKIVIYVPGNLEFSSSPGGHKPDDHLSIDSSGMPFFAQSTIAATWCNHNLDIPENVVMLYNATFEISGIRFVGTTLWTPIMSLPAKKIVSLAKSLPEYNGLCANCPVTNLEPHDSGGHGFAMESHGYWSKPGYSGDLEFVTTGDISDYGDDWKNALDLMSPEKIQMLHRNARIFLNNELPYKYPGKTVVVTHHSPVGGIMSNKKTEDAFNARCDDILHNHGSADYWVVGHDVKHGSKVGGTTILSNSFESNDFLYDQIIQIS